MESLAAILGGALAKIYDDGVDNGLLTDEYQKKFLETLQCFLLGALTFNHFTFSIVAYIFVFITYICDPIQYANPYETSLLIAYPFLILLNIGKYEALTRSDWILIMIVVSCLTTEPIVYKEEVSYIKLIMRALVLCITIGILSFDVGLSNSFLILLKYLSGYLFISVLFQAYSLMPDSIKQELHSLLHKVYTSDLSSEIDNLPSHDKSAL
jgi:hypothetical protein